MLEKILLLCVVAVFCGLSDLFGVAELVGGFLIFNLFYFNRVLIWHTSEIQIPHDMK